MQYIKGGFSFRLASKLDVWQRGFDSHRIVTPADFADRLRYILDNPIRAGLATWPDRRTNPALPTRLPLISVDRRDTEGVPI